MIGSLLGVMDNARASTSWSATSGCRTATSALAVGLALGASGTIFQQLLRNPLASPDFVGISSGASARRGRRHRAATSFGGLGDPGARARSARSSRRLLMYVLAWRDGVSGYRFILIGIGVAAFFDGLVGYLLTRAQLFEARQAMHWLTGSVGQAGDTELRPAAGRAGRAAAARRGAAAGSCASLELGDDTARGAGHPRRAQPRLALLAVAVVLTGLAIAVAGPIVFVALVAGPIANRLLGPATGGLLAAACVGAALLLAADLVAVHLLPTPLPTGVVTGAVGAPYLLWLLATTNRQGAGG